MIFFALYLIGSLIANIFTKYSAFTLRFNI